MTLLTDWTLSLDADQVLRGEGADPAIVRERRPSLVEVAELALREGERLLQPTVAYRRLRVDGLRHERLDLEGGASLKGALLAQHLAAAEEVVLLLCTIGPALEARVAVAIGDDPVFGLALDGVGSAAVEALATIACRRFEEEAGAAGRQASIPLSPGMIGWPVEQGQPQIFALLDPAEAGVSLTANAMMMPRKSLSMVLGLGEQVRTAGTACDFCSLNATCRYQDHYAKE
jgi:hypothetical protein